MSQGQPCRWCAKGYRRELLDADGTRSAVSGRPGVWGHAWDDAFWPCEAGYSRTDLARNPFDALRLSEPPTDRSGA